MQKYSETDNYILYQGNMLNMSYEIKSNTIDSIVTDPPYELNFMNKGWDNAGISFQIDTWQKCYEVLKPGGYLLAFGGTRTYHRIACAIENSGFEIRDCIMWLYGSGFPKSLNIGKAYDKKMGNERKKVGETKIGKTSLGDNSGWDTSENMKKIKQSGYVEVTKGNSKWEGYGTCLKPAYEPIIVARKPFEGSLVDNIIENSVGGINIDECRIPFENTQNPATNPLYRQQNKDKYKQVKGGELSKGAVNWTSGKNGVSELGRFPANVIHEGLQEEWSRYFYCAKASKKDRDEGLDEFEEKQTTDGNIRSNSETARKFGANSALRRNIHPTVKPTELMQYLVRLVTPKNGIVLDPFMGSGSTGKAVMYENEERNANYKFIGIELTKEYLPIAEARINYANKQAIKENKERQLNLFEME